MKQLLMLSALILSISAIAQETALIRVYGGPYNDYGNQIIETSDGGYAIIGTTGSYAQGNSKMYLLKLNSNLEKEWTRVYGGNNIEWGKSLVETEDGFLLLGYTNSFGAGGYDIFLVKVELDGNQQWQKTYGGSDWDFGYKIIEFQNTYYISGETWSFSNGGSDGYLVQIDSEGNELWSEHFGGSGNDALYGMFLGTDKLIAVGTSNSVGDKSKVHLIELDVNNLFSEFFIGEDNFWHEGRSGILHSNGDYYITGGIESGEFSNYLIFRLDTDFSLVPINSNSSGGSLKDFACDIIEVDSEQITLVGESASYTSSIGALIMRRSAMSNWQASPTFGGNAVDIAKSVIVNTNNELLIVGETESYGTGNFDVYLIKLPNTHVVADYILDIEECFDQLLTDMEPNISKTFTGLFPNPTTAGITIKTEFIQSNLILYNLAGQKIIQSQPLSNESIVSLENYPSGIYILQITTHSGTEFLRIIKE